MPETQQDHFRDQMIRGKRVLFTLGMIDIREPDPLTPKAVREGMDIYGRLLHFQKNHPLSAEEHSGLDELLTGLRVHLKYFGEDV
jgi:hypothetical protein